MKVIEKLYSWYGKRNVRLVSFVLAVLVMIAVLMGSSNKDIDVVEVEPALPLVSVAQVSDLGKIQSLQLIGTVRSVNEATVDSEVNGRITKVFVSLGEVVSAGKILAKLENATQYAALLQAEGVYEAALASAEASEIGVDEATNAVDAAVQNALSGYQSAYTTLNNIHFAQLDSIYADPKNTYRTPNFRPSDFVSKEGKVDALYAQITSNLKVQTNKNVTQEDIDNALMSALSDTQLLIDTTTLLRTLIHESDADTTLNTQDVLYLTTLSSVQDQLFSVKSNLQSAQVALTTANETLQKAALGSSDATISSANAQVKQALGSLKLAQANYEKTLLRSPISGILQELNVQKGDFVNGFQTVAKVTGDGSLEVTTYVGDVDRTIIKVGQIVGLENGIEGIVTHIAPAIDSVTKKTEVRIGAAADTLTNGDTVHITLMQEKKSTEVIVPLAAVKLTADNAAIFMVEDGVIVAKDVTLGEIRGASTVIESGLQNKDVIMTDVRGFTSGQLVEIR